MHCSQCNAGYSSSSTRGGLKTEGVPDTERIPVAADSLMALRVCVGVCVHVRMRVYTCIGLLHLDNESTSKPHPRVALVLPPPPPSCSLDCNCCCTSSYQYSYYNFTITVSCTKPSS